MPVCSKLQNPKSKGLHSRAPSVRPSAWTHPSSLLTRSPPFPSLEDFHLVAGRTEREEADQPSLSVTPGLQLVNIKTQELNATSLLGAMKALRLTAKSTVREQEVVTVKGSEDADFATCAYDSSYPYAISLCQALHKQYLP